MLSISVDFCYCSKLIAWHFFFFYKAYCSHNKHPSKEIGSSISRRTPDWTAESAISCSKNICHHWQDKRCWNVVQRSYCKALHEWGKARELTNRFTIIITCYKFLVLIFVCQDGQFYNIINYLFSMSEMFGGSPKMKK